MSSLSGLQPVGSGPRADRHSSLPSVGSTDMPDRHGKISERSGQSACGLHCNHQHKPQQYRNPTGRHRRAISNERADHYECEHAGAYEYSDYRHQRHGQLRLLCVEFHQCGATFDPMVAGGYQCVQHQWHFQRQRPCLHKRATTLLPDSIAMMDIFEKF